MTEGKRGGHAPGIVAWVGSALVWLILLTAALWAFGALWFDLPFEKARPWVAWSFGGLVLLMALVLKPRWLAKLVVCVLVVVVAAWWFTLQPRQFRDWKTEVALLPDAEMDGEVVTIHNVRNFDYRTETDFTPRYDMRRFNLGNLRGMDLFITYWGSPYMAHPIVSFDFGEDGRVCFSIETRPEKGEDYSALGGLYRQFELIYIAADERDVIRLRSNYRKGEDVYLYRVDAPHARESFMEYIRSIKRLRETPRWYNAVTSNCTTAIRQQRASARRAPWDWRMLVNGMGDQMLYERGAIDTSLSFAELKRISRINDRAREADQDPAFSERIRAGLPLMTGAR